MASQRASKEPTCFIAMPIKTRPTDLDCYSDPDHWSHVLESLFVPAVEAAGFKAIPPVARGAHLIHAQIIRHLSKADLVLCDLSSHNPNVYFELGVRTSLNLPIALVCDEHTGLEFDTAGINTHFYASDLRGWNVESERRTLQVHLSESAQSCAGANPLWRQFGLAIRAEEPASNRSPLEAKVNVISADLRDLISRIGGQYGETRSPGITARNPPQWIDRDPTLQLDVELQSASEDARLLATLVEPLVRGIATAITNPGPNRVDVEFERPIPAETRSQVVSLAQRHGVALSLSDPLGNQLYPAAPHPPRRQSE